MTICALCASRPAVDREHIPAQTLFPKPRPHNMITVPACAECNGGTSLDDEYLRTYFALRVEERPTPSLARIREVASRGLTRPQHRGLQETFARSMSMGWVPAPGGTLLTLQMRMTPDLRRVLRVIRKHARGLFYHITERVLPADTKLIVLPDHRVARMPPQKQHAVDTWSKQSLAGVRGNVGEVFGYALNVTIDNPNAFFMSLLFYKTFYYLVATRPRFFTPGALPSGNDHAINRLPIASK